MKPVDKKYNFLRPVKTPNLVRIGRKGDGGYVVDSKVIKETNLLITFGLGPDWSFELDYISKNPGVKIYVYDHTVSILPYIKGLLVYIRKFLTFHGSIKAVSDRIKNLQNYRNFLKHESVNFFSEKITYPIKNKIDTDINKVFSRIESKENIVLKCDIDGDEFRVIDEIIKYSDRIKMLIFEFHLDNNREKIFLESVKKIQNNFTIIHIHGNNHLGKLNGGLPIVTEITFLNKKYMQEGGEYNLNFPIKGLDYPNNPYKEDLAFKFEN